MKNQINHILRNQVMVLKSMSNQLRSQIEKLEQGLRHINSEPIDRMWPSHVVLHHSLTKDSGTVSWDAIRRWHMGIHPDSTLKYKDIGYHFGIELVGDHYEIFMGRMPLEPGAHCKQMGMNYKSIGICFIGNYDLAEPPGEMWQLGLNLVSTLLQIFHITIDDVKAHNEYASYKSCPGKLFDVDRFRQELLNRV